jgi:hypothetical protein
MEKPGEVSVLGTTNYLKNISFHLTNGFGFVGITPIFVANNEMFSCYLQVLGWLPQLNF